MAAAVRTHKNRHPLSVKTNNVKTSGGSQIVTLQWVQNPVICSVMLEAIKTKRVKFVDNIIKVPDNISHTKFLRKKLKDSQTSTKEGKSSKKVETLKLSRAPAKSANRLVKEKSGRSSKEFADTSIQDERENATQTFVEKIHRSSKNLEPVVKGEGSAFSSAFALTDEESWSTVPAAQVNARFKQYRELSRAKITELDEQLQVTLTKTHRKVNSIKSQFNEHKSKWEAERRLLIEQVEQAQKLQTDAEKEADAAMTQLEEFINEQEKLEDEEELQRQEIIKTISRPGTVLQASSDQKQKPTLEEEPTSDPVTRERTHSNRSEQELKNLMQQTDDAKVQEKSACQYGTITAPPAGETTDGQATKLPSLREHSFPTYDNVAPSHTKKPSTFKRSFSQNQCSVIADKQKSIRRTSICSGVSLSQNSASGMSETPGNSLLESQHPLSESQCPVSISSVKPTICQSPPPYMHNEVKCFHIHKETQTDELWLIQDEEMNGSSEDEVRQLSAKSRASLRNHFKTCLDETQHANRERHTKTPVISTFNQKSLDNELNIEEDDDDLPIPDDLKEEALHREDTLEVAISPPPINKFKDKQYSFMTRISSKLVGHPVVTEYLHVYNGVHNFKEAISRVLVDKDQMSASQLLVDLEPIPFHKEEKVVPQIIHMSENVYYVLNEVSQVINSVLQNDRGPVVSSLILGMSRDPIQRTIAREKSGADMLFSTHGSQRRESTKRGGALTDRHFKEQHETFAQSGPVDVSNDRLVNTANNNLSSHMKVTQPGSESTTPHKPGPGSTTPHKPGPGSSLNRPLSGSRPKSTPMSSQTGISSRHAHILADVQIPNIMSSSQPLPPIGGISNQALTSGSCKGRQSPPRMNSKEDVNSSPPSLSSI